MLEQINQPLEFWAAFTKNGVGEAGLSVFCTVYAPDGDVLINGEGATPVGKGLYKYVLSHTENIVAGSYAAVFETADTTVDKRSVYALWVVGAGWVENVDAASSDIKAQTDKIPTNPAAVGSAMTLAANQDVRNVTGNVSGSVGSVAGAVTVGTNNDKTGYALAANQVVKSVTEAVNLPAGVAQTTDIPTAAQVRTEIDNNSTKLATINSKLTPAPELSIRSAVDDAGTISITAGDDYVSGQIDIGYTARDLSAADTLKMHITRYNKPSVDVLVVDLDTSGSDDEQVIHVVLSDMQTSTLSGDYKYSVVGQFGTETKTLLQGVLVVSR